nr:extracellular solute-binding protein [Clostridia bacterium]
MKNKAPHSTPIRKISAFILALLTLLPLASCGNSDDTAKDTASAADTSAPETTGEPTNADLFAAAKAAMPKVDYEGHSFVIVDRDPEKNWGTEDVYAESENGEPINDAVYLRNRALEDSFNIKITERPIDPYSQVSSKMATEILSNDYTFDVITDGLSYLSTHLATPGYLVDLNEIPEIDLTQPYWDQLITEYMTIMGKTFFATGDISIMDNKGTWAMLFNKKLIEDFNLDEPYDHVNNGTWTLDVLHDMAKAAAVDLDGDGEMTEADQYGFLSENCNTFMLWTAAGERLTKMNDEGVPELCMYNDRAVSVVEKVQAIQLDRSFTITGSEYEGGMKGINSHFSEGGGLFIYGGLSLVTSFRSSDVDFGIIPAPKYDENQDSYYSAYAENNTTAYAIPITQPDLSRVGTILEQMAILSQYTLTPAYYDITLEGKSLRDNESADMIDIILATRNYDIGAVYNWGGICSMFTNVLYNRRSTDFASAYAAIESSAQTAIDSFVKSLEY